MKIQIVCLNRLVFLPYVHGLLRGYIEENEPDLTHILTWADPLFLDAPANEIAKDIDADILGLSCYVWNFRKHMKLAKLAKLANPDILVIAGGPHIPNDPRHFFDEHPYVDVLVHGEGEITFARVLQHFIFKTDIEPRGYSTANYFSELSLFGPKLPKDITISSPYQRGFLNASITEAHEAGLEFWVPWETNRGCPYQCSFCDWGSSLMNKVRRFGMDRITDDIIFFGERQIENVYICDANFGMLSRDEDIAVELVAIKSATGFPKQIRGSFAKNSNNRVFNITKSLMEAGMIYGTTLSMQSLNDKVLIAVDRENIGVKKYEELQDRYRNEGYHTYTELILGLPEETKDTFIHGVCGLMEAGNHEDIRVWELSILPNAPMVQHIDQYELKTVTKNVFLEHPKTALDEIETNQVVVASSSMSRADWVDSYLFSWTIQTLHCGYYTRYIAEYMNKKHGVNYRHFYETLISSCMQLEDCVMGERLRKLKSLLELYPNAPNTHLMQKSPGFGTTRRMPDAWMWLSLCQNKEIFYQRLRSILSKDKNWSVEMDDLFKFQESIMLDPSYDPTIGLDIDVDYNWIEYFTQGAQIKRQPSTYRINQTHTGVDDKYSLTKDDSVAFADAAVGAGFLVSRHRHYAFSIFELNVK